MTNSSKRKNSDKPQNDNSKLSGDYEINYNIKMDCDDDVIVISVGLYKFFMAHGKDGRLGKELYEHLVFTSRMQYGSCNVKANNSYLMRGLGWGDKTLRRIKSFLKGAGLIEYIQDKDNKSGKFGSTTILIKRMWDEESLSAWLYRKTERENQEAPEVIEIELSGELEPEIAETLLIETGGVESSPPVENAESTPEGSITAHRSNHPSGFDEQTNKERERKLIKREKEETPCEKETSFSPPAVSFSEIPELIKHLESLVEIDGKGPFFFPPVAKASLEHYSKIRNYKWVMDKFDQYKSKKKSAQIRRFCESDLPDFLTKSHEFSPKEKVKKEKLIRVCPVCGSIQPDSGTLNYCPRCTLPGNEFNDPVKAEEHREWWDDVQRQREATG